MSRTEPVTYRVGRHGPRVVRGAPPDSGAEGNARLTGAIGALLLVLLFVEGVTILRIRALIGLHVFVGLLIVPLVLLKITSTTYRFTRYYGGYHAYRVKGPPHPLLRLLGPFLVILTLAVLGTGIGLLAVPPTHGGLLLTAHQASFILWFAAMTVHVLGHLRETLVLAWRDWRPGAVSRARRARRTAIVVALVAGVALGALLLPHAAPWSHLIGHR